MSTILVSRPGIYQIAGTVYLGSNTTLRFAPGVFLKKVWDQDPFSHILINKGASTKNWNDHISVE